MNDRRLKIILIPVVLGIWGMVILRFFRSDAPAAKSGRSYPDLDITLVDAGTDTDTFPLNLNYRDPFLGTVRDVRTEISQPADPQPSAIGVVQPAAPVKPAPPPVWTTMRYHGLVEDSKAGRKTGLISFNGRMIYVDEGVGYEGFQIIRLFPDSVQIKTPEEKVTLIM